MTCEPLASTGLGPSVLLVAAVACLLLLSGALLLARRRGRPTPTALLLLLVLASGLTFVLGAPSPALAELPACRGAGNPTVPGGCRLVGPGVHRVTQQPGERAQLLTITQTSVLTGLAPGVPPVAITGRVVNNGPDDTYLAAIDVEVVEVVKHRDAVAGGCDASDYVLIAPRMPVAQPLAPGGTLTFGGASISFTNKSVNQDACQRATVALRYTAVPR